MAATPHAEFSRTMMRFGLLIGLMLVAFLAPRTIARAEPAAGVQTGLACGFALSAPIYNAWADLGGGAGRLGCPIQRETATSTSFEGSSAREAIFRGGTVIWHTSGPHAGQSYAVVACYPLYFQYGGPSGWLGLPISEAENTPDGQRQYFEGGALSFLRSYNACESAHLGEPLSRPPGAASSAEAAAGLPPLDLFHDPSRGDWAVAASQSAVARLLAANYQRVETEASVMNTMTPGAAPLKNYWNETASAHRTVATAQGERDALSDGYTFDGVQGYVWLDPRAGTVALQQYCNGATNHCRLVVTPEDKAQALAEGYGFVRIEGYAPAPP